MDRESVFQVVKKNVLEIIPDLEPSVVTIDKSLKQLGANSLDRVDVASMTMDDLNISMSMMELADVGNLADLVDIFVKKLS